MQRQRRLARAFRPVDLDDPALGQPADPQRDVEAERARRGRLDILMALSPPSFMIEPLPNCRSIWASALSSAFCLSADLRSVMSRRFAIAMVFRPLCHAAVDAAMRCSCSPLVLMLSSKQKENISSQILLNPLFAVTS
jgi:hypothetical protein